MLKLGWRKVVRKLSYCQLEFAGYTNIGSFNPLIINKHSSKMKFHWTKLNTNTFDLLISYQSDSVKICGCLILKIFTIISKSIFSAKWGISFYFLFFFTSVHWIFVILVISLSLHIWKKIFCCLLSWKKE